MAEIRLYYRTFRAMFVDEGPYDVVGEIYETLEHELEHHRAFLDGDDPKNWIARSERRSSARSDARWANERAYVVPRAIRAQGLAISCGEHGHFGRSLRASRGGRRRGRSVCVCRRNGRVAR